MTEIHLSEQAQKFINEQVNAGVYKSADDVVAAGLRLLRTKIYETSEASLSSSRAPMTLKPD